MTFETEAKCMLTKLKLAESLGVKVEMEKVGALVREELAARRLKEENAKLLTEVKLTLRKMQAKAVETQKPISWTIPLGIDMEEDTPAELTAPTQATTVKAVPYGKVCLFYQQDPGSPEYTQQHEKLKKIGDAIFPIIARTGEFGYLNNPNLSLDGRANGTRTYVDQAMSSTR